MGGSAVEAAGYEGKRMITTPGFVGSTSACILCLGRRDTSVSECRELGKGEYAL